MLVGMDRLPTPIEHLLISHGGAVLMRDLLGAGCTPDDVRRLRTAGLLVRIRRGAYVDGSLWRSLDPASRHLLAARAVLAVLKPPAVLSHTSAAVALGLPVWGIDLSTVHVTRPGRGQSRREAGVVHHNGVLPADQVVHRDGLRLTRADRTVVDVARLGGFEPGVVTADAALHRGLVSRDRLLELALAMTDWPGSRIVGRVVTFADGLAESVGESRSRVMVHVHRLPAPSLQVEIRSSDGRLLGRVDMLLEEYRTVLEFDGRLKYRLGEAGDATSLERTLWAEKRREDDIRAEGYRFVRVTWSDLDHPGRTVAHIRRIAGLRAA